ncbi:GNAT family N-acetyltransferase [Streptomyces purpureus]|uniref:GNAT family N-acetyltransferase n=1 Tax=Streptomyces purpureus TaxID=1951 RepID=UPI0037B297FC
MTARPVLAEPIRTARLRLVPLAVGHAEEMAARVLGGPRLHTFTGGVPDTVDELRARYRRMLAGAPDPGVSWCNWVVRLGADGQADEGTGGRTGGPLTGTVQATVTDGGSPGGRTAEVAWVIGTPWQGHGIAGEAARALVAWLWSRPVDRVVAHIHPDHHRSAAVAASAGLSPTTVRQGGEVRWQALPDPSNSRYDS